MSKINGNRYEDQTEAIDELIRHTLEAGYVLSLACDQDRHSFCDAENPDECWCQCHEQDS